LRHLLPFSDYSSLLPWPNVREPFQMAVTVEPQWRLTA